MSIIYFGKQRLWIIKSFITSSDHEQKGKLLLDSMWILYVHEAFFE